MLPESAREAIRAALVRGCVLRARNLANGGEVADGASGERRSTCCDGRIYDYTKGVGAVCESCGEYSNTVATSRAIRDNEGGPR